jgi:hypothetical protein
MAAKASPAAISMDTLVLDGGQGTDAQAGARYTSGSLVKRLRPLEGAEPNGVWF